MNNAEIEKEMDKLVKLGLLEERVVNGRSEFKITRLGKKYVETNYGKELLWEGDEE